MTEDDLIIGSAGGGGGKGGAGQQLATSRTPTESSDNLNSTATVEVLDLLGEGEIEGFATPSKAGYVRGSADWNRAMLKDIYFNNTPVLRSSASNTAPATSDYNFKNVVIDARYGTQAQTAINSNNSSGAAANEVSVGVTVEKATPVVRTITDVNVDAVRVTVTFPQLQSFSNEGDIYGASVRLQIAVQYNGGGYTTVKDDTVTGRTSDSYQRDYMINLSGAFPIDVRVTRVTNDSTSAKLVDAFSWTSYTEIVAEKLRYPNSALVGIRVNAEQFSSIPTRSYRVRGLKVQIPSNATVDAATGRITYSGVWNGTFGAAQWTSDPAWCLWNLLTNKRYGFGDYLAASSLDKWAFYAASQYCNELVPTGFGGTEPRFSMNTLIQTQEEAYKLINDLCSVFRAMPYWATGTLTIAQDKPADSSYLFTLANVTEEGFTYAGSDSKTRPTVAVVSYLDLRTREIAYEIVEDRAAITKYGVQTVEVSAFACTSRGQANRLGEWLLYSAQYETEVVSFTASLDAGVLVRPGQVIEIADPARAGARRGGRITSATTTTVTVDSAADLPSSGGTLAVILKDGTVESRSVSSRSGTTITVSSAFSSAPGENAIWIYSGGGISTSLWRVLTVQEQEGASYAVTALSYNASKYAYIERDRPLQQRDVTNLNLIPAAPTSLRLTESLYTYQAEVRAKVIITWRQVSGVNQYRVRWRKNQGNWNTYTTQSPDHEILNITPGTFEVEVYSLNSVNQISTTALTGTINALGKTAPPSNVAGLTAVIDKDLGVTLSWNPVTDLDLKDYEIRYGGSDWDSATFLAYARTTRYVLGLLDPSTTVYRVKARDTSNVLSATAAATTVTITAPGAPTVTHAIEDPVAAISWTTPRGSYTPDYYELRYGADFASGISVARVYSNSYNVPVSWSGTRTFWVAGVDPAGNTGAAGSRNVTINAAAAPNITAAFYGRSCTLTWNAVNGTLRSVFYEIRQGSTWATATRVARISSDGTGYSLDANWAGARTFWVAAVDANGNYGTPGSVVATINKAPAPTLGTTFVDGQLQISWQPVKGTLETAYYEVRRGSTFATATVLGKVNANYFLTKANWVGTQKFWVVAVDVNGLYGTAGS
jgi:predicted phage tail protein